MAKRHFRSKLAAMAYLLPDDVSQDDLNRLRHEIQRAAFWDDLRHGYIGAEAEWRAVQEKWRGKE